MRPDWPKGYYRKGAAFMALKEHKEARDAFMAAVKLDPENEEMHEAFCKPVSGNGQPTAPPGLPTYLR